ncbi:MAG: hypothetical protein AB7H43_06325 [Acidimicrobiia bacterium]
MTVQERFRNTLRRGASEDGVAMISVVMIGLVVTLLMALITTVTVRELDDSAAATRRSVAFQAAEAGIDDYIAKLAEDNSYYVHQVHVGESTRRTTAGTFVAAGSSWPSTAGSTWTYVSGKNAWRSLGNGYEYNLQITPPSGASSAVTILATGRRSGQTGGWRTIQTVIRPASVADFQRLVMTNVSYGSGASTRGKVYASGTISHDGDAYADLYAESSISGPPTYHDSAKGYTTSTNPSIRTKIPKPIDFTQFQSSLSVVRDAALAGGILLNDSAVAGWKLVFNANGTVTVSRCSIPGSGHLAKNPTCTTSGAGAGTFAIPSNGAIYSSQSVIVEGIVDGIVTVVSNNVIVVGGPISYETPGDDVLGLIASQDLVVASYVASNFTWRAAVLVQNGTWKGYTSDGSKSLMTFYGSAATKDGGDFTMFDSRSYNYDETLQYLRPPYYPFIEDSYTVDLFRELPSGGI